MDELYTKILNLSYGKLTEQNLNEAIDALTETKTVGELILSCTNSNETLRKFRNQLAAALKVNQSLTHLYLSFITINDEIASAVSEQQTITHIDLSHSRFSKECLERIVKNKNLQYLNLCSTIVKFHILDMSQNNSVPEDTFPSESRELVTVVIKFLQETTSVKCLNFSNNLITCEPPKNIFKALLINRSLTDLNLASNNIGIECIQELTEMLKHNKTLIRLDLSKNRLNSAAVKEIAQAMLQNEALIDINLSFNKIRPGADAKEFVIHFLQNENLTALNLSNNHLGDEALIEMATLLRQAKLTKLCIADNMELSLINHFTFSLIHNNTLSSLHFGINYRDNDLDLGSTSFVARNPSLGPVAVKEITSALITNEVITFLDFSFNFIGPAGAKDLAEFLKNNKTITDLNIRHNDIGNEGAAYIASTLVFNTCLLSLNLEFNDIGTCGAVALWKALKVNRTLTNLRISFLPSDNLIGIGINDLVDVLRCNNTLNNLYIGWYETESYIEEKLIGAALKENTSLLHFQLYSEECQTFPPDEEIQSSLERNRNLLRKISFIAKHVYTHRTEKELIFNIISKKNFEEFESYQGRHAIIKLLCESDFYVLEAEKAIDCTHYFIKNHFFEIAGIMEDPFDKLPLDILCKIASYLKLKDILE